MTTDEKPAEPFVSGGEPGAFAFQRFKAAFPGLYDHTGLFDFSPPVGWRELLWKLSEQLAPLGMQIVQVKSKFGGLRVYWEPPARGSCYLEQVKGVEALIRAAEDEASRTCQVCGQPGVSREGHPYGPYCEEHKDGRLAWRAP